MARKPKLTSGQRGVRHVGNVGGMATKLMTGKGSILPGGGGKKGPKFKKAPRKK